MVSHTGEREPWHCDIPHLGAEGTRESFSGGSPSCPMPMQKRCQRKQHLEGLGKGQLATRLGCF